MILTVTLNAALDVTYGVEAVVPHATHRVERVIRRAGGKGLNVSRVLHQLGHDTVVTGIAGGRTGAEIRADLDRAGIEHRLLDRGEARTSVSVVDAADATVFNEPGPTLGEDDWAAFLSVYDDAVTRAACVVLSGSLPPGLPVDAYARLCARTSVPCLVDAGGPALVAAARAGAAVLLPNEAELREATGLEDPAAGARALLELGAGAVVVSRGAEGLLAFHGTESWRAPAPERLVGNPTGAGDALAAAVAATTGSPWPDRLREALAWSAAAVPAPAAGDVDVPTLQRIRAAATIERLETPCP